MSIGPASRAPAGPSTDWAAAPVGAVWRAFDLQLATYAALLVASAS